MWKAVEVTKHCLNCQKWLRTEDTIIGIEREADYVEIAEKRIEHYRLPILEEAKDE